MKKIICVFISLIAVFSLVACDLTNDGESTTQPITGSTENISRAESDIEPDDDDTDNTTYGTNSEYTEKYTSSTTSYEESSSTASSATTAATEDEDTEAFSSLLLVNPNHPIPDGYVDSIKLTYVQNDYRVDSRCAQYLKNMIAAAKSDGISLKIISAFRTNQRQRELYNNRIQILMNNDSSLTYEEAAEKAKTINAYPGTSEHECGLAVDFNSLNSDFDQTSTYKWLKSHCAEYGFILRYPKDKQSITHIIYEPWHYRFVGVKNAKKIMSAGVTLEEYLGKVD